MEENKFTLNYDELVKAHQLIKENNEVNEKCRQIISILEDKKEATRYIDIWLIAAFSASVISLIGLMLIDDKFWKAMSIIVLSASIGLMIFLAVWRYVVSSYEDGRIELIKDSL